MKWNGFVPLPILILFGTNICCMFVPPTICQQKLSQFFEKYQRIRTGLLYNSTDMTTMNFPRTPIFYYASLDYGLVNVCVCAAGLCSGTLNNNILTKRPKQQPSKTNDPNRSLHFHPATVRTPRPWVLSFCHFINCFLPSRTFCNTEASPHRSCRKRRRKMLKEWWNYKIQE